MKIGFVNQNVLNGIVAYFFVYKICNKLSVLY